MSYRRIIPCLDIRDGRVVTGVQFTRLRDVGDPVSSVMAYQAAGADELVLLDIQATLQKRTVLTDLVARLAASSSIPLTVGGGLNTLEAMEAVLAAGAAKVSLNSAAVQQPALVQAAAERFGKHRLVVAIDARLIKKGTWEVVVAGGTRFTGLDVVDWAKAVARLGAGELLVTSMDRDGSGTGYDLDLTRAVSQAVDLPLVASGGAGQLSHFYQALTTGGADAVLAAGLFHDGVIDLPRLKRYLALRGLPMRSDPSWTDELTLLQPPFDATGFFADQAQALWQALKKDQSGRVVVITRDVNNREILMQAFMDREAFLATCSSGLMHYFSRSRKQLWLKGETSGHFQQLRLLHVDCDQDSLLADVVQYGSACHTGQRTCFFRPIEALLREEAHTREQSGRAPDWKRGDEQ